MVVLVPALIVTGCWVSSPDEILDFSFGVSGYVSKLRV
jgi:hypothetical protein